MFDRIIEMFHNVTAGSVIIVVLILAAIVGIAVLIAWRRSKRNKIPSTSRAARVKTPSVKSAESAKPLIDEDGDDTEGVGGEYPTYIITLDGSLDFDYIPHPLGDVFMADTSMPKSGPCYLVKEVEADKYEAYDPRIAPLVSDETPIQAWFATHWSIVREVFAVVSPWWKSTSLWIAGLAGVAAFIVALARVGG